MKLSIITRIALNLSNIGSPSMIFRPTTFQACDGIGSDSSNPGDLTCSIFAC